MPKCPRSSGPPRSVFGTGTLTSPERAGGGKKRTDLVEILLAGAALNARGDIDRDGAGNAHRLGQQLGGQSSREHPWAAPGPAGDQIPVEGEAVAARQRVRPARRLRIEQQQIRDLLVARGGDHVLGS